MLPDRHTVLLVEPDLPTRRLYERELGRRYQVLHGNEQHDILALMDGHVISAIILDLSAPYRHDWALLDAIQQHPAYNTHTPIILCSVLDERQRGAQHGAAAFLIKPCTAATLLHCLAGLIAA